MTPETRSGFLETMADFDTWSGCVRCEAEQRRLMMETAVPGSYGSGVRIACSSVICFEGHTCNRAMPDDLADLERRAKHCVTHHAACDCGELRRAQLEARVAELERALEPFADYADSMDEGMIGVTDDERVGWEKRCHARTPTVAHCRIARAALER